MVLAPKDILIITLWSTNLITSRYKVEELVMIQGSGSLWLRRESSDKLILKCLLTMKNIRIFQIILWNNLRVWKNNLKRAQIYRDIDIRTYHHRWDQLLWYNHRLRCITSNQIIHNLEHHLVLDTHLGFTTNKILREQPKPKLVQLVIKNSK